MEGGERGAAEHEQRGGRDQVAVGDPERVAEQQLLQPLRRVGREREQRAEAHEAGHRHRRAGVRADAGVARGEGDQRGGHERAARGAEEERRARERGEHEPGEEAVRERLGAVGEPLGDDPEAERAAEASRPSQARAARGGRCRSGAGRGGSRATSTRQSPCPCSWCWTVTRAARRPRARSARARRWPGASRGRGSSAGLPKATWWPFRHSTRSNERALSTSWLATSSVRPSARSSSKTPAISVALAGSTPGERLVEQEHLRVLDQRAGEQGALALAAGQLAEADARLRRRGRPGRARPRRRRARRGAAAATSGRAASVPIRATSSAVTGKSSRVRSVCATYAGRPLSSTRPVVRLELAEEDAEQGRLAAAVRAEHAHRLAGARLERDVLEHRHAVVARGELLDGTAGALTPPAFRVAAATARHTSAPSTATGGPGGHVEPVGQVEAGDALGERERERAGDKAADAAGEHARGGGRKHVDRGHEQGADRRDGGDGRHGHEREQQEVGAPGRGVRGPRAPSGSKPTADHVRPSASAAAVASTATAAESTRSAVSEAEQGAEQQPVDGRAGLEDVAGEDHAGGERRHEQQRRALAVVALRRPPVRWTPPA